MGACNSKLHTDKLILVWPTRVADSIRALFHKVFMNISELIKYITEELKEKDRYHLIIPFDCLEHLLQNHVYQFPQVLHIYVIYCGSSDRTKIEHRYHSEYENLHFYSMRELIQQLERDECDRAISQLNSIDRTTIKAIISLIEDRLFTKRSTDSTHLSQILKQYGSTSLHGFPVKHINDFDACFLCSSCQYVFQQPYRLKCRHRLCGICIKTQKSCAICSKVILLDKVLFDPDLKIKMQKLRTLCFGCEWIGQLKDYQAHLKEYHHEFITCVVYNRQIDENSFQQQQLTGTNRELFYDNIFSSDSKIIPTSLDGTCIWKISNISDLKNNAAPNEPKSVYSSPFYVSPNGYKMCARL